MGLVHHDTRVRQAETFSFGSAGQQNRRAATGFANAIRSDWAGEHLHRVVDSQRRNNFATWRIDVEVNVFASVLGLQIQQFHHNFVRVAGVNFTLQKNDAILQQQIAESHLPLALIALITLRISRS
jgi:hypothetical protein